MRIVDTDKIERVKLEAKKLIVEKGYHGASISEIAKRAKVSDGYLYRHYKNKVDLVTHIFESQLKEFHDFVFELLKTQTNARELAYEVIKFLFELHEGDPIAIRFADALIHDFEFEYPASRAKAIDEIMSKVLALGKSTREFSSKIREIDVSTTIFTIPIKYIDYKNKGYYKQPENKISKEEEIELLLNICMNALK